MKNLRYDVRTSVKDATIHQTVDLIAEDGDMEAKDRIMSQVLNTRETQAHAALVHLGWTPPGGVSLYREALEKVASMMEVIPTTAAIRQYVLEVLEEVSREKKN